jgi:hypothetical protein
MTAQDEPKSRLTTVGRLWVASNHHAKTHDDAMLA